MQLDRVPHVTVPFKSRDPHASPSTKLTGPDAVDALLVTFTLKVTHSPT